MPIFIYFALSKADELPVRGQHSCKTIVQKTVVMSQVLPPFRCRLGAVASRVTVYCRLLHTRTRVCKKAIA